MNNLQIKNVLEDFKKDIYKHVVKSASTVTDNHLDFFARNNQMFDSFRIIQNGHQLTISGDAGCYMFLADDIKKYFKYENDLNELDLDRITAKLVASDVHCGHQEFSMDLFRQRVGDKLNRYLQDAELDKDLADDLELSINLEVLTASDEDEARAAIIDFEDDNATDIFDDFWEVNLMQYTYRYVWCCMAIAWLLKQVEYTSAGIDKNEH